MSIYYTENKNPNGNKCYATIPKTFKHIPFFVCLFIFIIIIIIIIIILFYYYYYYFFGFCGLVNIYSNTFFGWLRSSVVCSYHFENMYS